MPKKGKKEASRAYLGEYDVFHPEDESSPVESWSLEHFSNNFHINVVSIDEKNYDMEFDMVGVDASVANSVRRILLAEVPTMAIDKVMVYNNTGILQDEVLAHRLGLLPIKVDPRLFEYRRDDDMVGTAEDTIKFILKVKCTQKSLKERPSPSNLQSESVYTKQMEWVPIGNQRQLHENGISPVDGEILLTKLRPGHEIDLEMHCVKGLGRDHAKFSPVATASYRLLPEIKLLRRVSGEQAHRLAGCFSEGVIEIVQEDGEEVAKVACSRKDFCSRNVFKYNDLKDAVELSKVKDNFIFSVESTGALPPDVLVLESFNILKGKCRHFLNELKACQIKTEK